MSYVFQFQVLLQNRGYLLGGIALTFMVTVISFLIGSVLGIFAALGKLSKHRIISNIASGYVQVIRNTPFLVQLYIIHYGVYDLGIEFTPVVAGCIALGLNTGGYLAEIFRSGIESVERGLKEAASSLALTSFQTFRRVVLPIAIRVIYPTLINQFVSVLLGSSIVSVITVHELAYRAQELASRSFRYFEYYIGMGLIYACLVISCSLFLKRLGTKLKLQVRW